MKRRNDAVFRTSKARREGGVALASEQSTGYPPPEPVPLRTGKGTAELKEIVVSGDGQTDTAGILEFAGVLAQEHGSHLIAIFKQPEPTATPSETFARGMGILDIIDAHRAELERILCDRTVSALI